MGDAATVRALTKKIELQVGETAEEKLFFSVFRSVTSDLFDDEHRFSAISYMKSSMPHLEFMGIDADWVRGLFKKAGVDHLYT